MPMEAGKQLFDFITHSPNNFHYLKACERMGDICVALGKFADAQKYYALLGNSAAWPSDYKIRAQVALGRSFLAQDNAVAADKAFDDALNNDASGELGGRPSRWPPASARQDAAWAVLCTGKTDAGPPQSGARSWRRTDEEAHRDQRAWHYNAQGTALRKADKPKEAIIAFLHVHLEYASQPDLDAEVRGRQPSKSFFHQTHFLFTHEQARCGPSSTINTATAAGPSWRWQVNHGSKPLGLARQFARKRGLRAQVFLFFFHRWHWWP